MRELNSRARSIAQADAAANPELITDPKSEFQVAGYLAVTACPPTSFPSANHQASGSANQGAHLQASPSPLAEPHNMGNVCGSAVVERPALTSAPPNELATFGAGCFWGTEKFFTDFSKRQPKGAISSMAVGFMGGSSSKTSYEAVCTGSTGFVEVLQLRFDPTLVSYDALCAHFFTFHDRACPVLCVRAQRALSGVPGGAVVPARARGALVPLL